MGIHIDDRPIERRLQVRPYDRVAALLVALLVILTAVDSLALLLWLEPQFAEAPSVPPIQLEINRVGRGDHAEGYALEKEPAGAEELEEFLEPDVSMLLEAVTDAVSMTAASWDAMATDATAPSHGNGRGDWRPPGPLDIGQRDILPEWERWSLVYNTSSLDAYARQLDHFQIELGALGGGFALVDYARGFSSDVERRQGKGSEEKRIYFVWSRGTLKEFDRRLLRRAGVSTNDRIVCQFISDSLRESLLRLELAAAAPEADLAAMDRREQLAHFRRIKRTTFGVRRQGEGYEFYVMGQSYRGGKVLD